MSRNQKIKVESLSFKLGSIKGEVLDVSSRCLRIRGRIEQYVSVVKPLSLELLGFSRGSYCLQGHVVETQEALEYEFVIHKDSLASLHEVMSVLRKMQHIKICQKQDVEADRATNGFERYEFIPCAVSEVSASELDMRASFLGRTFSYPILITGMTGGIDLGAEINRNLASVAQELNIPMGLGSQRIACEEEKYADIFAVKDQFPNVFLIGNLGAAQILDAKGLDYCKKAIDMVDADALAIHVNLVQELVQVEGDRSFKGLLNRLESICKQVSKPIVVKEVGSGIDEKSAKRLQNIGVSAIDVAGKGGTSWGYIEGLRSSSSETYELGKIFRNWGITTAQSLVDVRSLMPQMDLVATGGMRHGVDVAKACALGANMVGVGLPLLRAALQSREHVMECAKLFLRALEVTMVATESQNLSDLKHSLRAC